MRPLPLARPHIALHWAVPHRNPAEPAKAGHCKEATMALIMRHEPGEDGALTGKFTHRDEAGLFEVLLYLAPNRWQELGKPEALAVTYEPYEAPAANQARTKDGPFGELKPEGSE